MTRPGLEVIVRRLPPGGAVFLAAAHRRRAARRRRGGSARRKPGFDLPANIAGMIEAGVFTAASLEVMHAMT